MAKHRAALPQLSGRLFLTDGGIETSLIFGDGFELPEFAAFVLLDSDAGTEALRRYFRPYVEIAESLGTGFVGETATWRASRDWGSKLGYDVDALARVNRQAVEMLVALRAEFGTGPSPFVISGCIGPRGDAYRPAELMDEADAERYHSEQVETFRDTEADLVSAITMTYVEEAIGITRATQAAAMPVVVSFTVETDGVLPSGMPLGEAITEVDRATGAGPAYYMVNCAHPSHFEAVLDPSLPWVQRIRGVRANASRRSHAELDDAEDLDAGDPVELGADYARLRRRFEQLTVLGGCCGTDERHVAEIGKACLTGGRA